MSVSPGVKYFSESFALTGTGATDVYTIGDQSEKRAAFLGILVTDPAGSVATAAKVEWYDKSKNVAYTIQPATTGFPGTNGNLELICEPVIHMEIEDEIRVTGASGHHVVVSLALYGLDTGTAAQT